MPYVNVPNDLSKIKTKIALKMKRKIFKSWSMLENGQKQKRQKHLSITMKSLNLF